MENPAPPEPAAPSETDARRDRLAAALRENLSRRKVQQRARAEIQASGETEA